MKKKKKSHKIKKAKLQILMSLIPIIATLLILIGNSYAVFTYLHKSENNNIIKAGTLNLEVTDNGIISITNSYPVSDSVGLSLEGYEFSISNTGTLPTRYLVKLEKTSGQLPSNNLRYSINNGEVYTLNNDGVLVIDEELLKVSGTNNYILKLWIAEDASNDVLGEEFHGKLVIESLDAGVYADNSGAAYPKLDTNMIPIIYDNNAKEWVKVDLTQKWYDYNNKMWANVAIVNSLSTHNTILKNLYAEDKDCTGDNNYCKVSDYLQADAGTVIPMDDIVAMFVWIPRYNYTLYNSEQATKIEVNFEDVLMTNYNKKLGDCESHSTKTIGCAYTHPAFTLGTTELTGIWVGKFETGTNTINTNDEEKTSAVFIKPNLYSLTNQQITNQFKTAKALSSLYNLKLDTHMMKDSEWGAVAYLTNSQYGRYDNTGNCLDSGCEVWINNVYKNNNSLTGCSSTISKDTAATLATADDYCNTDNSTDYINGINAATTGNIYGIYDMSGGSYEYTMASSNNITWADTKYYNAYTSLNPTTACHNELCYGYALSETAGWNNDNHDFITTNKWSTRGGSYNEMAAAGIFNYNFLTGAANSKASFRVIVTK